MKNFEYIFFDCMETLIDLKRLPTIRDYAAWAYVGSGVEELWEDFDEFFRYYMLARQEISEKLPEHAEYEIYRRFFHIVNISCPDIPAGRVEIAADALYNNYWNNYKEGSIVRDDVIDVIPRLGQQFKLGVVSNFMVEKGIEQLLEMNGLIDRFKFVVTSVAEGWRKPHKLIYDKALDLAGVTPEKVIFVGDDYINDYVAPSELGMTSYYLDRYDSHPELERRVRSFYDLLDIIKIKG